MTGVALYEMAGQYRQLLDKLSDGDFDLTTISDTIEASGIVDEIAQKATGIEMIARTMEMHTPALDAEIERLTALKKRRQNAAKALRDYLRTNMQAMQITKLESPLFVIKLQMNPPAVDVYEPGLIPAEYMRQKPPPPPEVDKAAIKEAIKAGVEVPGARIAQSQRLVVN
jgi:hypothetical protein